MNIETVFPVSEILSLTRGGLYCLINDSTLQVDVRYSSNLGLAIGAILTKLKGGYDLPREMILDKAALKLKILEFEDDNVTRRLHHGYWCDYYKGLGYRLYRKHPAIAYNIKVTIENYKIYLRLQNRNLDSFVVGVFDGMIECQEFISSFYSGSVKYPVYCVNELSLQYFNNPPTDI